MLLISTVRPKTAAFSFLSSSALPATLAAPAPSLELPGRCWGWQYVRGRWWRWQKWLLSLRKAAWCRPQRRWRGRKTPADQEDGHQSTSSTTWLLLEHSRKWRCTVRWRKEVRAQGIIEVISQYFLLSFYCAKRKKTRLNKAVSLCSYSLCNQKCQ